MHISGIVTYFSDWQWGLLTLLLGIFLIIVVTLMIYKILNDLSKEVSKQKEGSEQDES